MVNARDNDQQHDIIIPENLRLLFETRFLNLNDEKEKLKHQNHEISGKIKQLDESFDELTDTIHRILNRIYPGRDGVKEEVIERLDDLSDAEVRDRITPILNRNLSAEKHCAWLTKEINELEARIAVKTFLNERENDEGLAVLAQSFLADLLDLNDEVFELDVEGYKLLHQREMLNIHNKSLHRRKLILKDDAPEEAEELLKEKLIELYASSQITGQTAFNLIRNNTEVKTQQYEELLKKAASLGIERGSQTPGNSPAPTTAINAEDQVIRDGR